MFGDRRPTAREVLQFVESEKHMADLGGLVEIDYEALLRLDDMSDEEAAKVIDRVMAAILLS
ncbi:hypothetical protein WB388_08780 [Streptomyces brasiliscabiei]|uniref:Uncharacterized protein n=1 Tax=Streptomyces brasiliscabiei TaxID=2736302 RepID=A0ABU8G9W6_9ACTN